MTPEDLTAAIHALQNAISEIKAILNNGIRTMVNDQKSELVTVKDDIQRIRDALTSHVAKEDVIYEIFKRVMNTGVSITGALITLLLAIIGYLLVHPVGLHCAPAAPSRASGHSHSISVSVGCNLDNPKADGIFPYAEHDSPVSCKC